MTRITSHKELQVYQLSFETGMEVFHITKTFPKEELRQCQSNPTNFLFYLKVRNTL